jgi:hypothetical protein
MQSHPAPRQKDGNGPRSLLSRKKGFIAVKLFDEEDDAGKLVAELGKGHYVEHRPGESVRCQSFCLCRDFCNFYRETAAAIPSPVEVKTAA